MKILLFAYQLCAPDFITGVDKTFVELWKRCKETEYDACSLASFHVAKGVFDLLGIWKLFSKIKCSADIAG